MKRDDQDQSWAYGKVQQALERQDEVRQLKELWKLEQEKKPNRSEV